MKVLIMVLSYDKHPFDELMKAQIETWEDIHVDGIGSVFYYGGGFGDRDWEAYPIKGFPVKTSFRLQVPATDSYYYMAGKFKDALKFVEKWDYDFIFRTNSSSYVHKRLLMEFARTLPTEKLYAGWTMEDSNFDGGLCVSGAGIFLSRDCGDILRKQIDYEVEMEEDVYIGRILRKNGITAVDERSRIDISRVASYAPVDSKSYHYRFKTDDRMKDVQNMRTFHKKLYQL